MQGSFETNASNIYFTCSLTFSLFHCTLDTAPGPSSIIASIGFQAAFWYSEPCCSTCKHELFRSQSTLNKRDVLSSQGSSYLEQIPACQSFLQQRYFLLNKNSRLKSLQLIKSRLYHQVWVVQHISKHWHYSSKMLNFSKILRQLRKKIDLALTVVLPLLTNSIQGGACLNRLQLVVSIVH